MISPITFINKNQEISNSQYREQYNLTIPYYYNDEVWCKLDHLFLGIRPWFSISNYGRIYNHKDNVILKSYEDPKGYMRISLTGIPQTFVHRLVAAAFIPNPLNLPFVNHIDGNKKNNHFSNLEWCTIQENNKHMYETGLSKLGEDHMWAVYTEDQIRLICEGLEERLSYKDICEKKLNLPCTNVLEGTIRMIRKGNNWKQISVNYNIPIAERNTQLLTDSEMHLICDYFDQGLTNKEVMDALDIQNAEYRKCVYRVVSRLRNRSRFHHITKHHSY